MISWPFFTPRKMRMRRGGSAGIRNLYSYVTSSGDVRYDNRNYAAIVQQKSHVRGQISAPSVPSCVCANKLSFKICVFQWSRVHKAVETAVTATIVMWERCKSWVHLEVTEIGEIKVPVAHERRLLWRLDLHQVKDLFLYFLKILTWWGVTSPSDLEL